MNSYASKLIIANAKKISNDAKLCSCFKTVGKSKLAMIPISSFDTRKNCSSKTTQRPSQKGTLNFDVTSNNSSVDVRFDDSISSDTVNDLSCENLWTSKCTILSHVEFREKVK